jgi:phosphohistidine phosphatase SixA
MRDALGQFFNDTATTEIYTGGPDELAGALAGVDDDVTTVLALGHNPGWEEVVEWLCGQRVRLTTANAALLEAAGPSWHEALRGSGTWRLHEVLRPKEL